MFEMRLGFESGLAEEQVKTLANPKFTENQMYEIRKGLEENLSLEQIRIYAIPYFTVEQMREMRWGFEHELNKEEVLLYADPKFDDHKMNEIRLGLEEFYKGMLTIEQVHIFAVPDFTATQMQEIRRGFVNGLQTEDVLLYADSKLSDEEMKSIRKLLEEGMQHIDLYKNALIHYNLLGIPEERAKVLAEAAHKGVSINKLDVIAKGHFTAEQTEFLISNIQKNTNEKRPDNKNRTNRDAQTIRDI